MMTTIVHDTTEAVCLCQEYNLFLKPIAKMTVSVALPQLKLPGKSISNWEVMERLKAMVAPEQFSALRISKSTMDFIRFEGEVENRGVVKILLAKLDGKSIKLSGFTDILKVRAVENKMDFPTRYDWDSFFRDAKDMNDTVPGERPDTIHLEGLPCRWFILPDGPPDRPSETALQAVFQGFGPVRHVDIPMLDPYREETLDKNFNTFTFGGHLNFEAYVQYQEYDGFAKAMDTLRGMKLMYKGEDGKAVACNIKVTFDTSKHLSDVTLKRRQQERLRIQELERQREEQKRREKEEEERKEEERKHKEAEEEEKVQRKAERIRKREQKLREREEKRNIKKVKRRQEVEQKKLQLKITTEERRLLLAQRKLESIRLIAELLSRAKFLKQQQQEKERAEREEQEKEELARQKEELARQKQMEACRREQEAELRRVELEKGRALDLQRRERELRERLVGNLLKKAGGEGENQTSTTQPSALTMPRGDSSDLGKTARALGVNVVRPRGEESPRATVQSHVTEKQIVEREERRGEWEERRGGREDREGGMEERRGYGLRSREVRERSRSHSRGRRWYSQRRSGSRRRRSSSRKRSGSQRRRRSDSRRRRSGSSKKRSSYSRRSGSCIHKRRSHHGRGSRSTSRDWSRSSSGRSHSRGRRTHRHSRHRDSRRRSSSSSSRSRERSREKDRSREKERSGDRSSDRDRDSRRRSSSYSRRH
ncbi:A-kinase anchor protein 17A-like [Salvelinus fontinalis]|uniref:A-kinase anchor protein 17A-like n=1 Tax=Salvelinus fontinalis TaxID=8038 RepID=UPI002485774D|nr:A-kinase anchor protein 17A-like [Salvelinus fontinalis]